MCDKIEGFLPEFTEESTLLILGSFPSVASRRQSFYYGNRQNRFWKMLFSFFGEPLCESVEGKRAFLRAHGIALWDIVVRCEIVGSADASIKNYEIADIPALLQKTKIRRILLNGGAAYSIFCERYKGIGVPYARMPSTSPANPRYAQSVWHAALAEVFCGAGQADLSARSILQNNV